MTSDSSAEPAEQVAAALRARLARLDEEIAAEISRPSDRGLRLAVWIATGLGLALVGLGALPWLGSKDHRMIAQGAGILLAALGAALAALRGGPLRRLEAERRRIAARLAPPHVDTDPGGAREDRLRIDLQVRRESLEREIASRTAARSRTRRLGVVVLLLGAAVFVAGWTFVDGSGSFRWTWAMAVAFAGIVTASFGLGLLTKVRFPTDELHDERRRIVSRLRRPRDAR